MNAFVDEGGRLAFASTVDPYPEAEMWRRACSRRFAIPPWETLYACDFFSVEILGVFGAMRHMVFFVIEVKSRAVQIAGVRIAPDGDWMEQIARNLLDPANGFLRASEMSYFFAASWRNQARIVSGRTIWQQTRRSSAVSSLPFRARRRRCSALKSILVLPVAVARASLRTRTSSRK